MKKYFSLTRVIFLFPIFLSSCQNPEGAPSEPVEPPSITIALEDITSDDGCLNIPAYMSKINNVPKAEFFAVTKKVSMSSKKNIRNNFQKLVAYSNFNYGPKGRNEISEIQSTVQEGCQRLIFVSNGNADVFSAIESTLTEITFANQEGRKIRYRYTSPTSLEVTSTHKAYDAPCGHDQEVQIETTKVFEWGDEIKPEIEIDSPLAPDHDYLTLVADAVGYNLDQVYLKGDPEAWRERIAIAFPVTPLLLTDKLKELAAQPVRQEVVACEAVPQPPPPVVIDDPEDGSE